MKAFIDVQAKRFDMYMLGEHIGLKNDALENFKMACDKITLELDVDPATGYAKIVRVNNMSLEFPVRA